MSFGVDIFSLSFLKWVVVQDQAVQDHLTNNASVVNEKVKANEGDAKANAQ